MRIRAGYSMHEARARRKSSIPRATRPQGAGIDVEEARKPSTDFSVILLLECPRMLGCR